MRLAFGDCVFDSQTRELLREGRARHLPPKAFELLEFLLEGRPRALSHSEIKDRLWPRTVVARSSLGRLMAQVRAAIGDRAGGPRLVRTVQRFGYAFCGAVTEGESPVRPRPAATVLRLLWGAREIDLREGDNLLGRTSGCSVFIDAPGVSRQHARIVVANGTAVIEDLGSKNGTFVGSLKLAGPQTLADGDEVALGTALLTLRALRTDRSTETVSRR